MKKTALIISAILLVTTIQAQLHFGPQIGFNASKLTLDTKDITTNLGTNFLFGAFVRIGEKIYVQPEVNWMTAGSVFKYPSISWEGTDLSPVEQDVTVSSIQIPVTVGWRIINLTVVNIRVFTGAAANIITNKTINTTDTDNSIGKGLIEPLTDANISDMTWQYHIGAGVDVLMFALDVKYTGAFSNILDGSIKYDAETHSVSSSTNMFVVTLGWKIF
ncbi:MAG: porin family protein [Bacteroidota bacterium]